MTVSGDLYYHETGGLQASTSVEAARRVYREAGLDAVPLRAKRGCRGWSTLDPDEQWKRAPADCNIGIRCGGPSGFGGVDADSWETVQNVENYLSGLGFCPVRDSTPSGRGRHFFLTTSAPEGFNWTPLRPEFGMGELRAGPGALFTVYPSRIGKRGYEYLNGVTPETLGQLLQFAEWKDIAPLGRNPYGRKRTQVGERLSTASEGGGGILEFLPIWLAKQDLPDRAVCIMDAIQDATEGQRILNRYPTRSHAVFAFTSQAILSGWSFHDILAEFVRRSPLVFLEQGRYGESWLRSIYNNRVLQLTAASKTRKKLAMLYSEISASSIPGRSGRTDLAVLLGIVQIAWKWRSFEVRASQREIQQQAAVSWYGARNALTRLEDSGRLIVMSRPILYQS